MHNELRISKYFTEVHQNNLVSSTNEAVEAQKKSSALESVTEQGILSVFHNSCHYLLSIKPSQTGCSGEGERSILWHFPYMARYEKKLRLLETASTGRSLSKLEGTKYDRDFQPEQE